MSYSEFKKDVLNECESYFKENRFYLPRKGCVLLPIDESFLGWVGMNTASNAGLLEINPFVGIHCPEIFRIKSSITKKKYPKGETATFAIHLGEICPEVRAFHFYSSEPESVKFEAMRLVSTILKFDVPYMHSIASYNALIPLLKERVNMLGGFPESYAIALFKNNELEKCAEFLEEHTLNIQSDGGMIVSNFEVFKQGLMKLMHQSTDS